MEIRVTSFTTQCHMLTLLMLGVFLIPQQHLDLSWGWGVKSDENRCLEELSLGKCGQRSVDSDAFLPLLHRLPQVANGEEHCLPSHLAGTEGSVWLCFKRDTENVCVPASPDPFLVLNPRVPVRRVEKSLLDKKQGWNKV